MNGQADNGVAQGQELAALAGAAVSAKPVAERVLLVPWGTVDSRNGDFVVDEESARLACDAFASHGTDLPIDYEHQTLGGRYSSPTGQAPAAGWITAIEAEPGVGLFARVRWTDAALEQLASGQYRYLSSVAVVRRSDRKLVRLHSAALTNKPAIAGMPAIVNRAAADAVDRNEALVALREQLALDEDLAEVDVLAAAHARIASLEAEEKQRDAEDRVAEAVRSGKLAEGQREWAIRLALREPALFDDWVTSAPVVIPLGRTRAPASDGPRDGRRAQLETHARSEYRSCPALASLTSEAAFVADAVRGMGN